MKDLLAVITALALGSILWLVVILTKLIPISFH